MRLQLPVSFVDLMTVSTIVFEFLVVLPPDWLYRVLLGKPKPSNLLNKARYSAVYVVPLLMLVCGG